MRFHKYHALGNDYIVMDPRDFPGMSEPTVEQIRVICHRNFGVGSDGILWGPLPHPEAAGGAVRIFNPDGSEAEKSGNGIRIFCRYLWDHGLVKGDRFRIATLAGVVETHVQDNGRLLTVDMGRVTFLSELIPVAGVAREVVGETVEIQGRQLVFTAASIGNPHCVVPVPEATADLARKLGPDLEVHPLFPRKTNVQFMQVLDRANIRIEIWERGAGYTLASGSSSSASAAVAHRLGLVDRRVTVHMAGGNILIEIGDNYDIRMSGPVTRVAEGQMHPELFTVRA